MKFFKYLIFISLTIFSVSSHSATAFYAGNSSTNLTYEGSTAIHACTVFFSSNGISTSSVGAQDGKCISNGSYRGFYAELTKKDDECSPQSIKSKAITVTGWTNWTLDQQDAYTAKIKGQTACYKGCKYKDPIIAGESDNQFKISFANPVKDSSCPAVATELPDTPYPDNVTPPTDGCKNGESYCDKPPTGCPSGYASGSFNGKQICVKNNPDPTKPNPNDPNNNPNNGNGKFDDSKIISAINDSKTAITNSINNAVNSINSSISSINQSITTVANAVNGTTNAVNNNTSAVNAVKSSVDALHNTINAVTTAVNNNTNSVTSAVNSNTSATNAVKASVDALNSTVSAVTSAVDNNTKAVNANGDKVSNAVKDNITATNAVKTAVDSLNSSVNAISNAVNVNGKNTVDAVNANGKNTVDVVNSVKSAIDTLNNSVNAVSTAVNANGDKVSNSVNANGEKITNAVNKGTEATKENGKKLDGIKDSISEGNGFLKEIRDGIKNINDTLNTVFSDEGKDEIDKIGTEKEDSRIDGIKQDTQNKFNKLANMLTFSNSPCISDLVINTGIFGNITIKFSEYCDLLALTKILIHLSVLLSCLRMVDATVRGL